MGTMLFAVVFAVLALASMTGASLDREMTVEVGAGSEECFFETASVSQILDIEYQVIDGGRQNEMEIDFRVEKPSGENLVSDYRKSDHTHRVAIQEGGDYKICFDNRRSTFSPKIVFFEIVVEDENEDEKDKFQDLLDGGAGEAVFKDTDAGADYDVKVQDIEDALRQIKEKMQRTRHFQDQIRHFEFRDRSVAEHNFERVNFWSMVQLVSMLIGEAKSIDRGIRWRL